MDPLTPALPTAIAIVKELGIPAVILLLWYYSERSSARLLRNYRDDVQATLRQYAEHMQEIRRMYENNAELVRAYEQVAKDLRNTVTLNTSIMQELVDNIRSNQYCPMIRIEKRAPGPQTNP